MNTFLALQNESLIDVVEEDVISTAEKELHILRTEMQLEREVATIQDIILKLIKDENLVVLERKLNSLKEIMNRKHYRKTEKDEKFVIETATTFEKLTIKHSFMEKIQITWKEFDLPAIPESVEKLQGSLEKMIQLKTESFEYGAFGEDDENNLHVQIEKLEELKMKVAKRNEMQTSLNQQLDKRDYNELVQVLKNCEKVEFIDAKLLQKCQNLANFLNPKMRLAALKEAMKSRDLKLLTQAIADFKEAKVDGHLETLEKSEKRLKKLIKIEKLNDNLRKAMVKKKIENLKEAILRCDESKTRNSDIPLYSDAQQLLEKLVIEELRGALQSAMKSRSLERLQHALQQIEESG